MLWNLINSVYKDGTPVPDNETAHMMIGLLMVGQHFDVGRSFYNKEVK